MRLITIGSIVVLPLFAIAHLASASEAMNLPDVAHESSTLGSRQESQRLNSISDRLTATRAIGLRAKLSIKREIPRVSASMMLAT